MRDRLFAGTPLTGLFRDLGRSVKLFAREELELAKAEMSEKISCYSHNAIAVVIGGFVAYAGLIVLIGGLGMLAAFAIQKTELDPMLANVIGLGGVGLLVVLVGAAMVLKALKSFSSSLLAPERTILTIKHLSGTEEFEQPINKKKKKEEKPKRSPEELKEEVIATEDHIGDTLDEIAYRTSPARVKDRAVEHIHAHPYTWSLAALGGGLIGSLLLMRRVRFGRR